MSTASTLFIYTESATHAGTGSGLGAVDLPIQREKTTGYPIIQGSGVKGALRSAYRPLVSEKDWNIVFGPEDRPEYAGAAAFGDAKLLAFPVRSAQGVMAWATSVDLLARFLRDTSIDGAHAIERGPQSGIPHSEALVTSDSLQAGERVLLEEYLYTAVKSAEAQNWADWLARNALPDTKSYREYYQRAFFERFLVLPVEDLRDFALYATEVVTRVKIDGATKTVVGRALFTQELLPADALLYVPVQAYQTHAKDYAGSSFEPEQERGPDAVFTWLRQHLPARIQIGGDETVGRGFVALRWGGEA